MRIRGGHISSAAERKWSIAGWAHGALALATALFLIAQGIALPIRYPGGAHAESLFARDCNKPAALPNSDAASVPAPAAAADHACGACLVCDFPAAIDPPASADAAATWREAPYSAPDGFSSPPSRRLFAHSPRAPPSLS